MRLENILGLDGKKENNKERVLIRMSNGYVLCILVNYIGLIRSGKKERKSGGLVKDD